MFERMLDLLDREPRWVGVPALEVPARVLQARMALHQGRNDEALRTLVKAASVSPDVDRAGLNVFTQLCLSVAHLRVDHAAAAWQVLAPVVARVRDSGEVGDVLLAGPDLLAELAQARWGGVAAPEDVASVQGWLARSRQLRGSSAEVLANAKRKDSALSAREMEVLALIAQGHSNKSIARELDLSPHTVKRHVGRILDRLDLASRAEAAAWHFKSSA